MYAKFVKNGLSVEVTPEAAVNAGDIVAFGAGAGIAPYAIAANTTGEIQIAGIFEVTNGHTDFDPGDPVYWDSTNKYTVSDSSKTFLGYAVADSDGSTSSAPTVLVSLCPKPKYTALTDNSGGTAGTTISVIGSTYSQTEIANAIASLAAAINKR